MLAKALKVWRQLRLEIGEAAIYTDGDELTDVVGLVAAWQGGLPVVRLTSASVVPVVSTGDDVETIGVDDGAAVERLRSITSTAPGVAAVDLSGNGEVISMLLEALPRWGRLLLAGPSPQPFTTAFYADVHRKGVVICAAGDPEPIDVRNARRLLADPKRAGLLRGCVRERV